MVFTALIDFVVSGYCAMPEEDIMRILMVSLQSSKIYLCARPNEILQWCGQQEFLKATERVRNYECVSYYDRSMQESLAPVILHNSHDLKG